ncbi:MAG: site-specific integrase [Hyphomicrobiaceae bacterium]
MSMKTVKAADNDAAGWLQPHRVRFLKALTDQGYAVGTLRTYDAAIGLLCREVRSRKIKEGQLVGAALSRVRAGALEAMQTSKRHHMKYCLERFIDALVEAGVAERPKEKTKAPTALDRLQAEYESYLRDQRGLTDGSIRHSVGFLKRFMAFRFGETLGRLDDITTRDVVDFIRTLRDGTAPRDKTAPSHLRNLFRFLFWSGKTKRDLAASIPRTRQPARSTLPRYLKPEDVDKLLDASWAPTPVGRRNYAMLMVLARLGLRAPEVIAIRLDDIDWRNGTILIRGKGKRHDRMPLPDDVGKAIVAYIQQGRRGTSRTLFVSSTPPHKPFVDAQILNAALKQAFADTGLKPPQKYVGSHLFRHSLATDMLQKGASLDEIADVLRHRSRMSTTIYARHDVDGLRSIALSWPNEKRALRSAKEARA